MGEPSPSLRHPVLLSMWALLAIGTGFGLSSSIWFVVVFLVSPFVAIATFAKVFDRREGEELRRGWSIAYHVVTAALALAAIAGVFATAGRLAGDDARWSQNGPIALLFLLTFLAGWPTVARPSPRRAAIPAMVVHVLWLPLVIADAVMQSRVGYVDQATWTHVVSGISLIAILALSAIAAVLAIVAFQPRAPLAPATARM